MAAALAMQIALEMDPSSQHHKHDMERLIRRIPQAVSDVLEVQHACSLVCVRPENATIHAHGHMCIHACTHMHTGALQHAQHSVQQLGSTALAGHRHRYCERCCTLYIHVTMMTVNHHSCTRPAAHFVMPQAGGSAGLKQWLADEAEQKKPEFLKQRPKYFYYYEWMKERICETYPALPEQVMDKLLTMPAGDLAPASNYLEGEISCSRFH